MAHMNQGAIFEAIKPFINQQLQSIYKKTHVELCWKPYYGLAGGTKLSMNSPNGLNVAGKSLLFKQQGHDSS